MSDALRADAVSYAYDDYTVLQEISLAIGAGVTGIIGPNGSGKSTLLRVLAGLIPPESGRVTLRGQPLEALSDRDRAQRIAFLPQSVQPVFSLSVHEVVCLGRYPHLGALGTVRPEDMAVADRCLKEAEADHLRNRDFLELSGGERQRVLLASVLAQEARVLLLDEPTAALDMHHQVSFLALLQRLARDGYGVAIVMHDLNAAARFCDQLLLLTDLEPTPVAIGAPESVLSETALTEAYNAPFEIDRHPTTNDLLIRAVEPEASAP